MQSQGPSAGRTDTGFTALSLEAQRVAAYGKFNKRAQEVMARLIHAACNDQVCGRHDVKALMDSLRAEGLHSPDDDWLDRITEGLNALYPLN